MSIDFDLEELEGVKNARTNYAKAECEVEFEEKKVNHKKIIEVIKKTGYIAELIDNK